LRDALDLRLHLFTLCWCRILEPLLRSRQVGVERFPLGVDCGDPFVLVSERSLQILALGFGFLLELLGLLLVFGPLLCQLRIDLVLRALELCLGRLARLLIGLNLRFEAGDLAGSEMPPGEKTKPEQRRRHDGSYDQLQVVHVPSS
jgi:hypothetical protein